jgi:hypothetical protein
MSTEPIDRKYRMQAWGRAYGFNHNDTKRMVFVDRFPDGWRYGCASNEEVTAKVERMDADGFYDCEAYAWVGAIARRSGPYRTRAAAIQAALGEL